MMRHLLVTLRRGLPYLLLGSMVCISSCGVAPRTDFPNRLIGADGQEFVLEDLAAIANDARLSDDEKRQAFRDLGLEDEELITALLNL